MLSRSSLQLTIGVKIFETYADCSVFNQKKSYHILYFIQMLRDNFISQKTLKIIVVALKPHCFMVIVIPILAFS
jgi:hypothetical protein